MQHALALAVEKCTAVQHAMSPDLLRKLAEDKATAGYLAWYTQLCSSSHTRWQCVHLL